MNIIEAPTWDEAVGTTPRAYFSYSCCVVVKHHANHGCVCVLAGVIRCLLLVYDVTPTYVSYLRCRLTFCGRWFDLFI